MIKKLINSIKTKYSELNKKKFFLIVGLSVIIAIFLAVPPLIVNTGKYKIYTEIEDVEEVNIAIVFGAGVTKDFQPSDMLRDRLITAYQLYEEDKVDKLLVSGDNRTSHYNEPQVMYDYLVEEGIPSEDIVRDFAGRRTYDTCYRAHEIFEIEEAILVSQGYHLPRAIFLCEKFEITSSGYSATRQNYVNENFYKSREILALYKSVLDIFLLKPTPVLGEKEKID